MGKSSSKAAMEKSSKRRSKRGKKKASAEEASTRKSTTEPPAETSQTGPSTSQQAGLQDDIKKTGKDVQRGNVEAKKRDEWLPAVVIDVGSYSCKYGLAGESSPDGEVRTIVGRHQHDEDDTYVGNDALKKGKVLDLSYPIQRGLVKNWDDMEVVCDYIFRRKLRVELESRPVVLTEPAKNPKENREKMIEIMFERFDVPAFYLIPQSMSALFTSGKMTGIVVDIGDGVTDIVPINNGVVVEEGVRRLELAGRDITEYMMKSPAARNEKITNEVAQTMKTSTCEVVDDFDEVTRLQREGQDVHHLYATEALFQPSIIGRNCQGITNAIIDSLMACKPEQVRDTIGSNVVLVGGSTLFRGFHARLERELMDLAPHTMPLKVLDRQDRENIVWMGASLFAALPAFKQQAVSREEYHETGPEIVHRKP